MHARFVGKNLKNGHTVIENITAKQIKDMAQLMEWEISRIWVKKVA